MFIFYDEETTGLEKGSAQIVQIGLVFTDENLNVLSSLSLESRRAPWVVPAPGAMLTTGFSPADLKRAPYSGYEMMRETETWIRHKHFPVIFSGYNILGFDEPVLERSLRDNLMPAGLTQEQGNGRFDVYTVVKAVFAYMPGALIVKELNTYGQASLALGAVARQNGVKISPDEQHDAMNDVRATLGLGKVLQKLAPQVWDQMIKLSTRQGVEDFVAANPVFTQSFVAYGKTYGAVVTSAADGVSFDLSFDPAPYQAMSVDELKTALSDKKSAFRKYDAAVQPIMMPMDLSDAVIPAAYDEKLYADRAALIRADQGFAARLAQAQAALAPPKPVEGTAIMSWMHDFHTAANWQEAATVVADFDTRCAAALKANPALSHFRDCAERIVFEHAPEALPQERLKEIRSEIAAEILSADLAVPQMTVAKARLELAQVEKDRAAGVKWQDATDGEIRALKLYYTAIEKEYAPYLKKTPGQNSAGPDITPPPHFPLLPPPSAPDSPRL